VRCVPIAEPSADRLLSERRGGEIGRSGERLRGGSTYSASRGSGRSAAVSSRGGSGRRGSRTPAPHRPRGNQATLRVERFAETQALRVRSERLEVRWAVSAPPLEAPSCGPRDLRHGFTRNFCSPRRLWTCAPHTVCRTAPAAPACSGPTECRNGPLPPGRRGRRWVAATPPARTSAPSG
jgi:hypothetical protein